MAFIVEDGSALTTSNSYMSLDDANAYFSDRGIVAWAGTDVVKQQALVRATDYIEQRFAQVFKGQKLQVLPLYQSLSFPRIGIDGYSDPVLGQPNPLPSGLLKATAEYALRALTIALAPDPTYDPSGYAVAQSLKKVGPIEKSTRFQTSPGSTREYLHAYPAADMFLRPLLRATSGIMRN